MKNTHKKIKKGNSSKLLIVGALLLGAIAAFLAFSQNNSKPIDNVAQDQMIAPITNGVDLLINAKDITEEARFYPYQAGDIYMEVIAVKASDGTLRTALNTCQVCYDSGRGYYKQSSNKLICNNCRNEFGVDDIEKIRGGCNPIPVLDEYKKIEGDNIAISEQFLNDNKGYFANWKRD